MLGDDARHWSDLGFGPWALFDRADDSYLGRVGLRYTAVETERAIELAWTVDPDRQGEGLATEAGVAAIALARRLEIEAIVALALPRNLASCRVAEKLGMRRDGEVDHAGLPHALYRLALA
jgi:RimJ/RimL family protein N-acetyltransferase